MSCAFASLIFFARYLFARCSTYEVSLSLPKRTGWTTRWFATSRVGVTSGSSIVIFEAYVEAGRNSRLRRDGFSPFFSPSLPFCEFYRHRARRYLRHGVDGVSCIFARKRTHNARAEPVIRRLRGQISARTARRRCRCVATKAARNRVALVRNIVVDNGAPEA